MAYATRFTQEFKSSTSKQYRITLQQDGYAGAASSPQLSADGFNLNYTSDNSGSGVIQKVMGSSLSVTFLLDDLSVLADLASAGDKTFLLKVEIYIALAYYDYFIGYVTPDLSGYADEPAPTFVSFTATDGFGWAKNYPFYDDSGSELVPITGKKTHIELLQTCLTSIGLINESQHATPLVVGSGAFREFGHTFGDPYLEQTRVDAEIFARCLPVPETYDPVTGDLDFTTTYSTIGEVLEYLCNFWQCRLFQSFGRWWFMPNDSFYDTSMVGYTYVAGATTNTATLAFTSQYASSSYDRLKGGRFQYFPAKNNANAIYNYFLDPVTDLDFIDPGESYTVEGYYPAEITMNFHYDSITYKASTPFGTPVTGETYGDLGIPGGNTIRFLNIYKISINDEWYFMNRVVKVAPNVTTTLPRWVRDVEQIFSGVVGFTLSISGMDGGRMPDMERMIYVEVNGETLILDDEYSVSLTAKSITFVNGLGGGDTIKVLFMYSEYAHYHVVLASTPGGTGAVLDTATTLSPSVSSVVIPKGPDQGTMAITSLQVCRPVISITNGDYIYYPKTHYISDAALGLQSQIYHICYVSYSKDVGESEITATYPCMPPNNGSVNYLSTNTNSDQSDSSEISLMSGDGLFPDGTNASTNCLTATEVQVGGQWELSDNWVYSSANSMASIIGTHHELIAKIQIGLQPTPTRFYQGTIFEDLVYAPTYGLMLDLDGGGDEPLVPINLSFNANMDHWTGKWLQITADVSAAQ
jgi:hypothetical protein